MFCTHPCLIRHSYLRVERQGCRVYAPLMSYRHRHLSCAELADRPLISKAYRTVYPSLWRLFQMDTLFCKQDVRIAAGGPALATDNALARHVEKRRCLLL